MIFDWLLSKIGLMRIEVHESDRELLIALQARESEALNKKLRQKDKQIKEELGRLQAGYDGIKDKVRRIEFARSEPYSGVWELRLQFKTDIGTYSASLEYELEYLARWVAAEIDHKIRTTEFVHDARLLEQERQRAAFNNRYRLY